MEKTKIILYSLVHAFAVLAYVAGFAYLVHNGSDLFIDVPDMMGMMLMLLVFVFSAGLMAVLVFGRPVYLFVSGLKKEGLQFLASTMSWMLILIVIVAVVILTIFSGSING